MNHPERDFHTLVADYLDWALIPSGAYWFPVPNASRRTKAQAANMKRAKEMKPGVPDMHVVYAGLNCIELKAPGKPAKPNPVQKIEHDKLRRAGARVITCNSLQGVYEFLKAVVPDLEAP